MYIFKREDANTYSLTMGGKKITSGMLSELVFLAFPNEFALTRLSALLFLLKEDGSIQTLD